MQLPPSARTDLNSRALDILGTLLVNIMFWFFINEFPFLVLAFLASSS
jgi:hypothetical protein